MSYNVHIVCTGLELVNGNCINTNSTRIAQMFKEFGIVVKEVTTVPDDVEMIKKAILKEGFDVVFINGGFGPTKDDLTMEALSLALNKKISVIQDKIKVLEEKIGIERLRSLEDPYKVISTLEGSTYSPLELGTVPGGYLKFKDVSYMWSPGPPFELNYLIENFYKDILRKRLNLREVDNSFNLRVINHGESKTMELLSGLSIHKDLEITPTVKNGYVSLNIEIRDDGDSKELLKKRDKYFKVISQLLDIRNIIYEEGNFEEILVKYLLFHKLKISCAESCTGGLLSSTITDVSGASNIMEESFVTYSNESKNRNLNVSLDTLKDYGAVSAEVVKKMAIGLKHKCKSQVQIAISGILGPLGDTRTKEIGLVYFSLGINDGLYVFKKNFKGDRKSIKECSVNYIMCEAITRIRGLKNEKII